MTPRLMYRYHTHVNDNRNMITDKDVDLNSGGIQIKGCISSGLYRGAARLLHIHSIFWGTMCSKLKFLREQPVVNSFGGPFLYEIKKNVDILCAQNSTTCNIFASEIPKCRPVSFVKFQNMHVDYTFLGVKFQMWTFCA